MGNRVCPWWLGYFLASPVRRLFQDPAAIVQPYIREGMTVLEPGPVSYTHLTLPTILRV